jgi:hypothetical protein
MRIEQKMFFARAAFCVIGEMRHGDLRPALGSPSPHRSAQQTRKAYRRNEARRGGAPTSSGASLIDIY